MGIDMGALELESWKEAKGFIIFTEKMEGLVGWREGRLPKGKLILDVFLHSPDASLLGPGSTVVVSPVHGGRS